MTPAEYHEQQLEKLHRLWDAGNWPALFQTVRYCGASDIPLPEWASLAVLNMIQDRFHDGSGGGADGAHGSLKGRLKMDYAHYLRWKALSWAMALNLVSELPAGRGRKPAGAVTKSHLLKEAADQLRGQGLARAGDGRQIEESYRLVDASRCSGEKRFAFDDLYFPLG